MIRLSDLADELHQPPTMVFAALVDMQEENADKLPDGCFGSDDSFGLTLNDDNLSHALVTDDAAAMLRAVSEREGGRI